MKYTMRKSTYMDGYEPEMFGIYLTPQQAAALFCSQLMSCYTIFGLAHFEVSPPAVHVLFDNLDRVVESFDDMGIIPPYRENKEYFSILAQKKKEILDENKH